MSEQIDWSKAPEDATHCYEVVPEFFKKKDGKWMVWFGLAKRWAPSEIPSRHENLVYRPTSPQWSGEGLPPVGVVCDVNPDKAGWRKSVISYVGDGFIAWLQVGDLIVPEYGAFIDGCEFRPIRTPEQIAHDMRDAEVDAMVKACPYPGSASTRLDCAALYDAGYRKP